MALHTETQETVNQHWTQNDCHLKKKKLVEKEYGFPYPTPVTNEA